MLAASSRPARVSTTYKPIMELRKGTLSISNTGVTGETPAANVPSVAVPSRTELEPSNGSTTRSEEHTSELQSLMRISYAVSCLKKQQLTRNNNIATAQHEQ